MSKLFLSKIFTEIKVSKFKELFDIGEIQKLQNSFSAATGVASIITEPDGTPITEPSGFCDLCNEIRSTEKGFAICKESDSSLGVPKDDGPNIRKCLSAGLWHGEACIIVNGIHIANWLIGQVLDEDSKIVDLLEFADEIGMKQDIYCQRLALVKRMPKQQFEAICNYLYLNAQLLSKYVVQNISLMKEIKSRIQSEEKVKRLNTELEEGIRKRTSELVMTNGMLEESNAELEEINAMLEEEIGKRQKAEDEINTLNKELETRVAERTNQLQELNAILEEEIAEKILAENELKKYQILVEKANDVMMFLDREGNILEVNYVATRLYGYTFEEFSSLNVSDLRHYHNTSVIIAQMEEADRGGIIFETVHYRKDGSPFYVEVSSQGANLANKRVLLSVIRDISDRKKRENENRYLSYHDALTGLYNRRFYEEEIKRLDTKRNLPISIIMGDVNDLKLINDAFGHDKGDELLRKAAAAIQSACRTDDVIARWGGDEFIILLPKTNKEEAENVVRRIKHRCLSLSVNSIQVSISFGWETKIRTDEDLLKVLKCAEDFMYKVKIIENEGTTNNLIKTIINTLHEKNPREEQHSKRVSELCQLIGSAMGLPEIEISRLRVAGLLHDIGKIAIEEGILNKPEKLTEGEWEQVKNHPDIGYRIMNTSHEMLELAGYILAHHERWDGNGYPKGLKGESIPKISRIIALADSYDAMISMRPYKKALTKEQAIYEIQRNSGTQFDPEIVSIFIEKLQVESAIS